MRNRLACLAVAAAAFTTPACDAAAMGPQATEHVAETRRLDAQGTFSIENTNGAIAIETWTEASVSIEAEKVGPEDLLDDIRVEIHGEGGRVDVRTQQPRVNWGRSGRVDYRIKVPEKARVEVETTNGSVRVVGTSGDLRASTTNGAVELADLSGNLEASTTNGSIKASFRKAPEGGWQRLRTTNGSVTLTLPAGATGDFEASTVNGSISTDFPLQVDGRIGRRRLRGRLGEGLARFDMKTVNGRVRILKRLD
jgi:Putative adhesin